MTKRIVGLGLLSVTAFCLAGGCKHAVTVPIQPQQTNSHVTGSATIGYGPWSVTFSYRQLTNGCILAFPPDKVTEPLSNNLIEAGASVEADGTNVGFRFAAVDTPERRQAVTTALNHGATLKAR